LGKKKMKIVNINYKAQLLDPQNEMPSREEFQRNHRLRRRRQPTRNGTRTLAAAAASVGYTPTMIVYEANGNDAARNNKCKLLLFSSGACRIMGCKKPLINLRNLFPVQVKIVRIQSVTVSMDLNFKIQSLSRLYTRLGTYPHALYEPELFPALRILKKYQPLCVNVFSTGKVMILGLKTTKINSICRSIRRFITAHCEDDDNIC
jgi:hypothetical protein